MDEDTKDTGSKDKESVRWRFLGYLKNNDQLNLKSLI